MWENPVLVPVFTGVWSWLTAPTQRPNHTFTLAVGAEDPHGNNTARWLCVPQPEGRRLWNSTDGHGELRRWIPSQYTTEIQKQSRNSWRNLIVVPVRS